MRRLLRQHPDIAVKMLAALAERLRKANERLLQQSFQTVAGRVASALLTQVIARQAEGAPDNEVLIKATQAEIAHLAGTSRESASRFLATLEREGVVGLDAGRSPSMSRRGSGTTSTDRYAERRTRMVARQLRGRGIEDERVLEAMATVPRERFVPPDARRRAYRDGALRIGAGQTISQPWIVARMAQALELRGDELVLEVGAGSGYGAAVLSRLCREVITIERHAELAEGAAATLAALGYDNVAVRAGDGTRGAPDRAPFDGISVTATARGRPPPALVDQLAADGRLVCPLERDGRELLVRLRGDELEALANVRFVPLVSDEA